MVGWGVGSLRFYDVANKEEEIDLEFYEGDAVNCLSLAPRVSR